MKRKRGTELCEGDELMRLSPLGWVRPRARVRVVDEKGDICCARAEARRDGRAERTRLGMGGGLMGSDVRRGI